MPDIIISAWSLGQNKDWKRGSPPFIPSPHRPALPPTVGLTEKLQKLHVTQRHCHFVSQQSPHSLPHLQLCCFICFILPLLSYRSPIIGGLLFQMCFLNAKLPETHQVTATVTLQNALLLAYWSPKPANPTLAQPLPQPGCSVLSSSHLVKSLTILPGSPETPRLPLTSFHTDFHQLGTLGGFRPCLLPCVPVACVLCLPRVLGSAPGLGSILPPPLLSAILEPSQRFDQ